MNRSVRNNSFAAMARAHSGCEVWQQDFLKLELPEKYSDGVFANATYFMFRVRAIGTCSSVMPLRPWRSFRYPTPSNVTWLRLSRVSRKRSSNNVLFVVRPDGTEFSASDQASRMLPRRARS
jgi:hypothetical protein